MTLHAFADAPPQHRHRHQAALDVIDARIKGFQIDEINALAERDDAQAALLRKFVGVLEETRRAVEALR